MNYYSAVIYAAKYITTVWNIVLEILVPYIYICIYRVPEHGVHRTNKGKEENT